MELHSVTALHSWLNVCKQRVQHMAWILQENLQLYLICSFQVLCLNFSSSSTFCISV